MNWEAPKVVEIRMDAEIGSYQEDFGGDEDPRGSGRDGSPHERPCRVRPAATQASAFHRVNDTSGVISG